MRLCVIMHFLCVTQISRQERMDRLQIKIHSLSPVKSSAVLSLKGNKKILQLWENETKVVAN